MSIYMGIEKFAKNNWKWIALVITALIIFLVLRTASGSNSESTCKKPKITATKASGNEIFCALKIKDEFRTMPYQRAYFKYESDIDGDRYWTCAEILLRDSTVETYEIQRNGKKYVRGGRWFSVYDNKWFLSSDQLQVDHLVPLEEAWNSGAWNWSDDQLKAFGNDLRRPTLIVSSIDTNQSKGASDIAEWIPAENICLYAQMWIVVKYRWTLSIDVAESVALQSLMRGNCGLLKLDIS